MKARKWAANRSADWVHWFVQQTNHSYLFSYMYIFCCDHYIYTSLAMRYVHIYIHTYIYIYIHACIYIYIRIYIYMLVCASPFRNYSATSSFYFWDPGLFWPRRGFCIGRTGRNNQLPFSKHIIIKHVKKGFVSSRRTDPGWAHKIPLGL